MTLLMLTVSPHRAGSPRPSRLVRGSCSSVRGFASGFFPTPPRDDAVASGSESPPPVPPEDSHLQTTAHAGHTRWGHSVRPRNQPVCPADGRKGFPPALRCLDALRSVPNRSVAASGTLATRKCATTGWSVRCSTFAGRLKGGIVRSEERRV